MIRLRRLLRWLDRQLLRAEPVRCTGIAAAWCPIHGSCRCPDREEDMNDPACPLHASTSTHADEVWDEAC